VPSAEGGVVNVYSPRAAQPALCDIRANYPDMLVTIQVVCAPARGRLVHAAERDPAAGARNAGFLPLAPLLLIFLTFFLAYMIFIYKKYLT